MKIKPLLILIFCFKFITAQTDIYDSITHASLKRTYLIHIPSSYNPANPTPLIIGLHGGGALSWYSLEQMSQLISKSNSSGFLLVYPEGIKYLGSRTWNGGGCCGYAVVSNIDDVGYINALIDTLRSQYNIDTTRIYATGISNGSIMAYRLACELSNRIAAIAIVAGTLEDYGFVCNPSRPIPIIQFHSTLDSNIFLQGGYGTGVSGYSFNSVNYGLQKFATFNNCNTVPDSNYYTAGNSFYYKKRWHSCNCNTEEILYVTGDGGHSWPGGDTGNYPGADPPSSIVNANDSIWDFFQTHTLICAMTSINDFQNTITAINIYPNPFSTQTTIHSDTPLHNAILTVYNCFGQSVAQVKNINGQTVAFIRDNLASGLYFVQLTEENKIIAIDKLIITDK